MTRQQSPKRGAGQLQTVGIFLLEVASVLLLVLLVGWLLVHWATTWMI